MAIRSRGLSDCAFQFDGPIVFVDRFPVHVGMFSDGHGHVVLRSVVLVEGAIDVAGLDVSSHSQGPTFAQEFRDFLSGRSFRERDHDVVYLYGDDLGSFDGFHLRFEGTGHVLSHDGIGSDVSFEIDLRSYFFFFGRVPCGCAWKGGQIVSVFVFARVAVFGVFEYPLPRGRPFRTRSDGTRVHLYGGSLFVFFGIEVHVPETFVVRSESTRATLVRLVGNIEIEPRDVPVFGSEEMELVFGSVGGFEGTRSALERLAHGRGHVVRIGIQNGKIIDYVSFRSYIDGFARIGVELQSMERSHGFRFVEGFGHGRFVEAHVFLHDDGFGRERLLVQFLQRVSNLPGRQVIRLQFSLEDVFVDDIARPFDGKGGHELSAFVFFHFGGTHQGEVSELEHGLNSIRVRIVLGRFESGHQRRDPVFGPFFSKGGHRESFFSRELLQGGFGSQSDPEG